MRYELRLQASDTTVFPNDPIEYYVEAYGYYANDTNAVQDAIFEITLRTPYVQEPLRQTHAFRVPPGATVVVDNGLGKALPITFSAPNTVAWPGRHILHARLTLCIADTGQSAEATAEAALIVLPAHDASVRPLTVEELDAAKKRYREAALAKSLERLKHMQPDRIQIPRV